MKYGIFRTLEFNGQIIESRLPDRPDATVLRTYRPDTMKVEEFRTQRKAREQITDLSRALAQLTHNGKSRRPAVSIEHIAAATGIFYAAMYRQVESRKNYALPKDAKYIKRALQAFTPRTYKIRRDARIAITPPENGEFPVYANALLRFAAESLGYRPSQLHTLSDSDLNAVARRALAEFKSPRGRDHGSHNINFVATTMAILRDVLGITPSSGKRSNCRIALARIAETLQLHYAELQNPEQTPQLTAQALKLVHTQQGVTVRPI